MEKNIFRREIWEKSFSKAKQESNNKGEIMNYIIAALIIIFVMLLFPFIGFWISPEPIPTVIWGILGGDFILLIASYLSVYVVALKNMWNVAEEEHKKQETKIVTKEKTIKRLREKIISNDEKYEQEKKDATKKTTNKYLKKIDSYLKKQNEIDVDIKPFTEKDRSMVGLQVTNNNQTTSIKCKAYISRYENWVENPKEENKWVAEGNTQFDVLSWVNKKNGKDGFIGVFGKPESIILRKYQGAFEDWVYKDNPGYFYKSRIEVKFVIKTDNVETTKSWSGCIDWPNVRENKNWSELQIWECEDAKNWK